MQRNLLILGTTFGLIAVILGAFGAHGLKELLDANALDSYQTGVRYQFYHAFLALFVGIAGIFSSKTKKIVFWLLLIGVLLFSGSIYLLSTSSILGVSFKSIAFLTPFGGLLMIVAWLILLVNVLKMNTK